MAGGPDPNRRPGEAPESPSTSTSRLDRQLRFVMEADALKQVERQTLISGGGRRENSAEHSWHLALMAVLLSEHAAETVDVSRVVMMLLVHDIVEIDAGDTFVYDEGARASKADREREAAERLFGLLPGDQAERMLALWEEFEERTTPEARFAASLDRLQPLLLNSVTGGHPWQRHGVTADRVLARNAHVADGSLVLWARARQVIDQAVADGILAPGPDGSDGAAAAGDGHDDVDREG